MGLEDAIGTMFVKVVPDTAGFGMATQTGIAAQSGAATKSGKNIGKKIGAGMAVAAGAALVKGIGDFSDFERGMNEVFTLLPNASEEALGQMEDDLKSFSIAAGVMPDEVITPLYDAISAGVPRENVFTFLEEANEFAKAGAVDLSTSVDALTTGVNAFGLGADGAGRVSDALFTAVKLGKTTVDELSRSLFQVAPIAASFGVSVEEVSAGFAVLTAQGTPTKVAATQLKSAIAELGKSGTKASDAFKEITGKSFPDFIAEGGNLVDAADWMATGADDLGVSMVDMFGSIEAGQAFVGLSADIGKSNAALESMSDATGATAEAFETMEEGIGPAMDRTKAALAVAFLEIGTAMAPVIEGMLPFIVEFARALAKVPGPMLAMGLAGAAMAGALLLLAGPILKVIKLMQLLKVALLANPWVIVAAAVIALAYVIYKNWDEIKEFLLAAWDAIKDKAEEIWNGIKDFFTETWGAIASKATEIWNGIKDFFKKWWKLALVVMTGGVALIVGALIENWDSIWGTVQDVWNKIKTFFQDWWRVLIVIFLGPLGVLVNHVTKHWDTIVNITKAVFQVITDVITFAWDAIKAVTQAQLDAITMIVTTAWSVIQLLFTVQLDLLKTGWSVAWNAITAILQGALAVIQAVVTTVWDAISSKIALAVGAIKASIDLLSPVFTGLSLALGVLQAGWSLAWTVMTTVLEGIKNTIVRIIGEIKSAVSSALGPLGSLASAAGGLGGGILSTGAKILGFDEGGIVPGPIGAPQMVLAHGGETILPTHKDADAGGTSIAVSFSGPITIRDDRDVLETGRMIGREAARELKAAGR